jgi:hypothetical protein
VGTDDLVCPINVRIHNSYESFDDACQHQKVKAPDIGFTLSAETRSYASKLANQSRTNAPSEAAVGGEAVAGSAPTAPADKDCFAEIWAGKLVPPPYPQTFNTKSNLGQGGHVVLHLYRGDVCLEDGNHHIIYPRNSSSLSPPKLLKDPLQSIIPAAHADDADACPKGNPGESATFDRLINQLASEEPDDATSALVAKFRSYECNIYDLLLAPETAPNFAARLLKVITLAPVGWSNAELIANDAFPVARLTRPSASSIARSRALSSVKTTTCATRRARC